MGHDVHFLERLDRVADAHVERALTLYRDEALLKEVLNRAGLAEGVERLAISLDDPVEGPFIIVTRQGRFVTCLGKGMRVTKEPGIVVLSRERLDAAAAKVERMRAKLAELERLTASDAEGRGARVIRRIAEDGLRFCREDAETLLVALPLLADVVAASITRGAQWLREHREPVAYLRFDKLRPAEEALALAFGRASWAMAHLLAFADDDDVQRFFAEIRASTGVRNDITALMASIVFDLGTLTHATRALWLLGRRPRLVLHDVKHLDTDPRAQMRVMREFALGTIALASTKHRGEAMKALWLAPKAPSSPPDPFDALDRYSEILGPMVHHYVTQPAKAEAEALACGRALAAQLFHPGRELSDAKHEAIPEPIARALLASVGLSWLAKEGGSQRTVDLAATLPWIARAKPAELFLPREYAQALPVDPLGDVAAMVGPYAEMSRLKRPKPATRGAEKVGRNDPCRCGSGKKRKRCCGA